MSVRAYTITENAKGGILVTLLLDMDFKDVAIKVTREEDIVRAELSLYRTYDLIFEGRENDGFRVLTTERDADRVIAEVKKWIIENQDKLTV